MKNYVYKITNNLNNMIYIGVHKTDNINDGYMGSGTAIKEAIDKCGLDNFKKEILFEYNHYKDAYNKERELVNESFIKRTDTYNIVKGGGSGWEILNPRYSCTVKDENGNCSRIPKDDPRYLSGELVGVAKNTTTVKDENGKTFRVSLTDPRYLSGELVGTTKGNKLTKEHKTLISQSSLGHKKKESTKNKMSQSAKNRIWINKDGKTSHCTKEKLQEKQNDGWKIGRK